MDNTQQEQRKYQTLSDIRHRKEMALAQIRANNKEMGFLWKSLFDKHQPKKSGKAFTVSSVLKTGIGVFDGILFVWKIYRKFKK
ncbi:MAG: hypothetical protein LUC91_05040 [Prevotella sp.]|nr:hypothetical protein [Prevotella sp.]